MDDNGRGDAHVSFAGAAHRAVVDVDLDLGLVRVVQIATAQDVGRALNPLAVGCQIEGGVAQGVGLAVMEEILLENGRIRNAPFTDYLIPTALDMPDVVWELIEEPEPGRPSGPRAPVSPGRVVDSCRRRSDPSGDGDRHQPGPGPTPGHRARHPVERRLRSGEGSFTGSEGRIAYRWWRPESPIRRLVVVVHGYAEHGGRYAHVAQRLVAGGAAVCAPDHLGHGRSEGERALLRDFEHVVDDLEMLVAEAPHGGGSAGATRDGRPLDGGSADRPLRSAQPRSRDRARVPRSGARRLVLGAKH